MKRRLGWLAPLALLLGCGGDATVQLGAVLPLTGEFQIYGLAVQKGVELAFDELRTGQEGDGGPDMTLSVLDSAGDPAQAAALTEQLFQDGALAVIGGVTSDEALEMVPVAERAERVIISPSASNPGLTGISKYFYRVFISDTKEGTAMATFATQKHQVPTVVILAKENAYARGIQEVFKTEFERLGGEVLDLIEFPAESSDFTGLVDRVMTVQPAAVYLAAYAEDDAALIRALRERNYKGHIYATSAFATPEVLAGMGELADNVYLTQAAFDVDAEDGKVTEFVEAFREKYGEDPDLYAAHGYDAVMVVSAAWQNSRSKVASEFWAALRGLRDFSGVTGPIQFDERGDVQKFPRVYIVSSGQLIDFEAEVVKRREELLRKLRELEQRTRQSG